MEPELTVVRVWPGMRSEYAWLPPHEFPTVTGRNQVGVAFTGHRGIVRESRGRSATADVLPGSIVVSGSDPITWTLVREPTEALEIYPEPELMAQAAAAWASGPVHVEQRVGHRDGTVLAIASILRRQHVTGAALSDVAASTLAHRLVSHLLGSYAGVRVPGGPSGRLDPSTVDKVADFVESHIGRTITLDDLAVQARLSPFHFSRAFRATTGQPPYEFVTARRLERARVLLLTSSLPVADVAGAVGVRNLSHFRRLFRRFHGVPPSALRT